METARGPNSILFGIARPGGVLNTSTKRARTHKDSYEFTVRVDSEGGSRLSTDFNKVLLPEKLAIRFSWLDSEEKGWRGKTDKSTDDRFFFTTTYHATPTTNVRVEWEHVNQVLQRAKPFASRDHSSLWEATGATRTYSTANKTVLNHNEGVISNGAGTLVGNYPGSRPFDFEFDLVPRDAVLIGDSPGRFGEYDFVTVFLEQSFGDSFNIELAAYQQEIDRNRNGWQTTGEGLFVDAEEFLEDGVTPNPYFEEYFIESRGNFQRIHRDQENLRATASYDLDLGDKAGSHTIVALAEHMDYYFEMGNYFEFVYDLDTSTPELERFNNNPINGQNVVWTRRYVDINDPSTLAWPSDIYDTAWAANIDQSVDRVVPARTLTNASGGEMTTVWSNSTVRHAMNQSRNLDTWMIATQSKFLNDKLMTSFGYRNDKTDFLRHRSLVQADGVNAGYVSTEIDPVPDFSPIAGVARSQESTVLSGGSRTLSALYHVSDQWSLLYNHSNANGLNPEHLLLFPDNGQLSLFSGVTDDIGVRFRLVRRQGPGRADLLRAEQRWRVLCSSGIE